MRKIIFILPIAIVALFLSSCDYKPLSVNQSMEFVKVSPDGMTPFLIGKYEVSQREWRSVMGNNPSYHQYGDDCPVENVSYEEVQEFLEKLNENTGNEYRLPTREEWMAAARSANREFYAFSGCNENNVTKDGKLIENDTILRAYAVYRDNSRNVRGEYVPAKRGIKEPNRIGLYDMSGNVSEMTCDTIAEGDGVYVKGGTCYSTKDALKIDAESQILFGVKGNRCGFRLVREEK